MLSIRGYINHQAKTHDSETEDTCLKYQSHRQIVVIGFTAERVNRKQNESTFLIINLQDHGIARNNDNIITFYSL